MIIPIKDVALIFSAFIFFALMIMLAELLPLFLRGLFKNEKREYLYQRQEYFMTERERKFFLLLIAAIGEEFYIFAQVHLPTLLDHHVTGQRWSAAFSHISQKSVDFVVCDRELRSVLAIELDDWSHDRPDRQDRDGEVERMLREANIPLFRLRNFLGQDPQQLREQILKEITQ